MPAKNQPLKGTLLERGDFFKRLNNGEIFKENSWNIENVRYVGYDITIAEDFLILPKKKSIPKHKFKKGDFHEGKIKISPGETIFVSSNEKVKIPWDLYGNIGTKFYLQANGIILYTGLMIEPGLGFCKNSETGLWEEEDDERLHFFLFNGGEKDFIIRPKIDTIATVQFFNIEEIKYSDRKTKSGHGNQFIEEMFNDDESIARGITFFEAIKKIDYFDHKIENLKIKVSTIEKGTSQIILFGVYLVSVTILGISLQSIIAAIQKIELLSKNDTLNTIISGLLILLFSIAVGISLYLSYKMFKPDKQNKDESRNRN